MKAKQLIYLFLFLFLFVQFSYSTTMTTTQSIVLEGELAQPQFRGFQISTYLLDNEIEIIFWKDFGRIEVTISDENKNIVHYEEIRSDVNGSQYIRLPALEIGKKHYITLKDEKGKSCIGVFIMK